MSHDNVVSRTLEGSFRKRERQTGKEKGGLEKRKDVVRTVLQSGPLWLPTNRSNFVLVLKCNGHVSV